MLDRGTEYSPRRGLRVGHAANREVVRLRTAAGKDDLAHGSSDEPRDPCAGLLQRTAGALAAAMDRSGVGLVRLAEAGDSGAHFRPQRCAGVVVEINAHTSLI